jgi:hypothetical protein
MALGNPDAFRAATEAAANPPGSVKPLDIWYPFASELSTTRTLADGTRATVTYKAISHSLDRASHWIVIALCAALCALWWKRRDPAGSVELLLAALLLLRVIGDPHAHPYHHAPFVLALAVAEARRARSFPWATVGVSALLAVTLRLWDLGHWTAAGAFYLAWSLPAFVAIAAAAFGVLPRMRTSADLR